MQVEKHLRKSLRRLDKAVVTQEAIAANDAVAPAGSTLAGLKSALSGGGAVGGAGAPSSSSGIQTMAGPPRTKKLRYSFNTSLREARLEADLEDLTDDEDEVRLADKIALSKPGGMIEVMARGSALATVAAAEAAEEAEGGDADGDEDLEGGSSGSAGAASGPEMAGVKMAADKALPKRDNTSRLEKRFASGPAGLYESDPALVNPNREHTHRKGKAKTEKAKFRFWE